MNHAKAWLGGLLFAIALCFGCLLDGAPTETDALHADSLNLSDAKTAAVAAWKERK